ncbi:hypothetical protein D3C81_1841640 [compost metagenome]
MRVHQVGAVAGAGQPAFDDFVHGVLSGGDVFADQLATVAGEFRAIARGTAVAVLVVEVIVVGHVAAVILRDRAQRRVPGQRCGSGERLTATLTRLAARGIELTEQLLPLTLRIPQLGRQQRPR